jgi:hypothetical protein
MLVVPSWLAPTWNISMLWFVSFLPVTQLLFPLFKVWWEAGTSEMQLTQLAMAYVTSSPAVVSCERLL